MSCYHSNTTESVLAHVQETIMDALDHLASAKEDLVLMSDKFQVPEMVTETQELQSNIASLRATKTKLLQDIARLKEEKKEAEDYLIPSQSQTQTQEPIMLLTQKAAPGKTIGIENQEDEKEDEPMNFLEDSDDDDDDDDDDSGEEEDDREEKQAAEDSRQTSVVGNVNMLEEEKEEGGKNVALSIDVASFTTATSGSSFSSLPGHLKSQSKRHSKEKHRVNRSSIKSPKKWRRMMRSHRLQSILIGS